ncbi:MAG: hypothetical protein ACK42K_10325, partial [Leptonema sp. (in: bacteria)]
MAILNGISLTLFIPLFDALGDKDSEFVVQFSQTERKILQKVIYLSLTSSSNLIDLFNFSQNLDKKNYHYFVPEPPKKIDKELSNKYLYYLNKLPNSKYDHLTQIERLQLRYII